MVCLFLLSSHTHSTEVVDTDTDHSPLWSECGTDGDDCGLYVQDTLFQSVLRHKHVFDVNPIVSVFRVFS